MKCLCCNKELSLNETTWHRRCIRSFFGTTVMPKVDLKDFDKMGAELISNKNSVTGVQRKLSLHLSEKRNDRRLTLMGNGLSYIIKPEGNDYPFIARAEHLVMSLANLVGIETPMHGLIPFTENSYLYITKRMDRNIDGKIHMEDFAQLSERPSEYKYNSSYEKVAKIIDRYCPYSEMNKAELFYRLLFCYVVGNSDMHLKNFSVIEVDKPTLSPAYDLLPVKIIVNDVEDMALPLNGKKRNITKNDFYAYGLNIGLTEKTVTGLIAKLLSYEDDIYSFIEGSLLPDNKKDELSYFIADKLRLFK